MFLGEATLGQITSLGEVQIRQCFQKGFSVHSLQGNIDKKSINRVIFNIFITKKEMTESQPEVFVDKYSLEK